MREFLEELQELLKKHNAVIIRSASSEHELVVSLPEKSKYGEATNFTEVSFEEEIGVAQLRDKRYAEL